MVARSKGAAGKGAVAASTKSKSASESQKKSQLQRPQKRQGFKSTSTASKTKGRFKSAPPKSAKVAKRSGKPKKQDEENEEGIVATEINEIEESLSEDTKSASGAEEILTNKKRKKGKKFATQETMLQYVSLVVDEEDQNLEKKLARAATLKTLEAEREERAKAKRSIKRQKIEEVKAQIKAKRKKKNKKVLEVDEQNSTQSQPSKVDSKRVRFQL
ncbi:hypothetical protein HK102_002833 [Quaeritorhiza haematococci]|nr:hypothetical protein HK102_002833 [Quaeritorhiza haematococci]